MESRAAMIKQFALFFFEEMECDSRRYAKGITRRAVNSGDGFRVRADTRLEIVLCFEVSLIEKIVD